MLRMAALRLAPIRTWCSRLPPASARLAKKPLIVKLSPNVTDITEVALAAEQGGADALSLINTLLGMAIDIKPRRPILKRNVGGLSGPAVKPVAVRMVWQAANAVRIPVIGMGGIASWEDAVEFLLAGAKMVSVGCGMFGSLHCPSRSKNGIAAIWKRTIFSRWRSSPGQSRYINPAKMLKSFSG